MIAAILFLIFALFAYWSVTKPGFLSKLKFNFKLNQSLNTANSRLKRLLAKADQYYLRRHFSLAEKTYLKVLKIDHRNLTAYNRLGFIYAYMGNFSDAIECFKIVVDAKPNANAYQNLGMVYFKNQNFTKAATVLEKAAELKPEPQRLVALARVYRVINKYSLQISALEKALDLDKNNIRIMQLLAEAYLHHRDKKKATNLFRKILKIDPQNIRARQELASK